MTDKDIEIVVQHYPQIRKLDVGKGVLLDRLEQHWTR